MNTFLFHILLFGFLLQWALCQQHQMTSSATGGRQRYAVLKSFSMTGIRNVRWETMPMNTLDADGKPISSKASGTKASDGTTVFSCIDVTGKEQPHNSEYQRPNKKFYYKCNNGIEEVLACVGSNRTNQARIEVGKTLDVDGFWHKCQSFPNSSVVYTEAPSCKYEGKEYPVGGEFTAGFLRLQCNDGSYKAVGCSYLDENKNHVPLNVGEQKEVGKLIHVCEDKGTTIQYYAKSNGCSKAEKEYKEGETFSQNHLHYKCNNGLTEITGCYIDEKKDLNIDQDLVEKNMVYRCYRLGPKIEYTEYACGINGTPSCTPDPIPHTADEVPTLGQGLKSPGFGSFAIAQTVSGSDNGGIVKLDLDKLLMSHQ